MREILSDIRQKWQDGEYKNEEHVRLSLVCRLLSELGWDIWSPMEVNTEFKAIPTEDNTKVDIALFAQAFLPSVFIEAKAPGKIAANLTEIERQVRDYNRNNTALFSVITDGRTWRLYYSQTGGEFHQKCFKEFDLVGDDLDDLERIFSTFLAKENIVSGRAKDDAGKYLQLTNKQKTVQDSLPQARRLVQVPPYPSLPQAIAQLTRQKGVDLSETDIAELLSRIPESPTPVPPSSSEEWVAKPSSKSQIPRKGIPLLNPDNPGDLRWTKVEGTIDGKSARTREWRDLAIIGIRLALQSGYDVQSLNADLPINIIVGNSAIKSYYFFDDFNVTIPTFDAGNAAKILVLLAKNSVASLTLLYHGPKSLLARASRASYDGLDEASPARR